MAAIPQKEFKAITDCPFKEDLIKQFSKFIITDGEYSSGLYTNTEGIFLERMYR